MLPVPHIVTLPPFTGLLHLDSLRIADTLQLAARSDDEVVFEQSVRLRARTVGEGSETRDAAKARLNLSGEERRGRGETQETNRFTQVHPGSERARAANTWSATCRHREKVTSDYNPSNSLARSLLLLNSNARRQVLSFRRASPCLFLDLVPLR